MRITLAINTTEALAGYSLNTHMHNPDNRIATSPHDLRRTVASFLLEINDDYVLRQQYLDHRVRDVHVKHYA